MFGAGPVYLDLCAIVVTPIIVVVVAALLLIPLVTVMIGLSSCSI